MGLMRRGGGWDGTLQGEPQGSPIELLGVPKKLKGQGPGCQLCLLYVWDFLQKGMFYSFPLSVGDSP